MSAQSPALVKLLGAQRLAQSMAVQNIFMGTGGLLAAPLAGYTIFISNPMISLLYIANKHVKFMFLPAIVLCLRIYKIVIQYAFNVLYQYIFHSR